MSLRDRARTRDVGTRPSCRADSGQLQSPARDFRAGGGCGVSSLIACVVARKGLRYLVFSRFCRSFLFLFLSIAWSIFILMWFHVSL
jgi:hypothetical protein